MTVTLTGVLDHLTNLSPISFARRDESGLSLMEQVKRKYDDRALVEIPYLVIRRDILRLMQENRSREKYDMDCVQALVVLHHFAAYRSRVQKGKGKT